MGRRNIGQTTNLLWLWMWMKKRRAAAAEPPPEEGGDGTQLDFAFAENSMHVMTVL